MRNTPRQATKTGKACVQRASGPPPNVEEIFTRLSTRLQCPSVSYAVRHPIGFCTVYRISSAPCKLLAPRRRWNGVDHSFAGGDRGNYFAILRLRSNRQNGNHKMAL